MKSGIYKIENKINGKFYLGVTKDFKDRFRHHKSDLNLNKHHSIVLQRAWNKYGKDNFNFIILMYSPVEYLYKLEQWFLKEQKPQYNIAINSQYNIKGTRKKLTEKHKENIRIAWTEEKRKQNGELMRLRRSGTSLKESTKNKIGKANSKLLDNQVKEIRELIKENKLTGREIANLYKVSPVTISQIKKGKVYGRIS